MEPNNIKIIDLPASEDGGKYRIIYKWMIEYLGNSTKAAMLDLFKNLHNENIRSNYNRRDNAESKRGKKLKDPNFVEINITQEKIADRMIGIIDRSMVARILQEFEKIGLIERVQSKSRNRCLTYLLDAKKINDHLKSQYSITKQEDSSSIEEEVKKLKIENASLRKQIELISLPAANGNGNGKSLPSSHEVYISEVKSLLSTGIDYKPVNRVREQQTISDLIFKSVYPKQIADLFNQLKIIKDKGRTDRFVNSTPYTINDVWKRADDIVSIANDIDEKYGYHENKMFGAMIENIEIGV